MDKSVIKNLLSEYDRADANDRTIIEAAQARINSRKTARLAVLNSLTREERRSISIPATRQETKPQVIEPPAKRGRISTKDIRAVVDEMDGRSFTTSEIKQIVVERHPGKTMRRTAVPGLIYILKNKGELKEVTPKDDTRDATYTLIR